MDAKAVEQVSIIIGCNILDRISSYLSTKRYLLLIMFLVSSLIVDSWFPETFVTWWLFIGWEQVI